MKKRQPTRRVLKVQALLDECTWNELATIQRYIRRIKPDADGVRDINESSSHDDVRDAASELSGFFDDVLRKHHGF